MLLYAHHDVQPPGREELWKTPPFEPTRLAGPGGERMYARGAADDKAGIFVHMATLASFLSVTGELPINVKVVIEGEGKNLPNTNASVRIRYKLEIDNKVVLSNFEDSLLQILMDEDEVPSL